MYYLSVYGPLEIKKKKKKPKQLIALEWEHPIEHGVLYAVDWHFDTADCWCHKHLWGLSPSQGPIKQDALCSQGLTPSPFQKAAEGYI